MIHYKNIGTEDFETMYRRNFIQELLYSCVYETGGSVTSRLIHEHLYKIIALA